MSEAEVGATGGDVSVASGPLGGLAITVPAGAFETAVPFEVSLTEITDTSYGSVVTPLSPLITVDNGGGYSLDDIEVRVPVRVPDGWFAMGFFYDDGALEAMPLVSLGADHVTVATRHFSSFFIGAIEERLLPEEYATGYWPEDDAWSFVNYGTYPQPWGICAGMSLTSMWYFAERKATEGPLWDRWDDNGRRDSPTFWQDDSWALRWATAMYDHYDRYSLFKRFSLWLGADPDYHRLQHDAFRYAMYVTGQPQFIAIWNAAGTAGHAMVVYAQTRGSLWVADPNYPGDYRQILFDEASGTFLPYNSGLSANDVASGNEISFTTFGMAAKSALVPWPTIGALYDQLQAGTVGADSFPTYSLLVRSMQPDGTYFVEDLRDGYLTSLNALEVGIATGFDGRLEVYRGTTSLGETDVLTSTVWFSLGLNLGANDIGFYLRGWPPNGQRLSYVDFRRLTLYRSEETTVPPPPPDEPTPPPPSGQPDCGEGFEPVWHDCDPLDEIEELMWCRDNPGGFWDCQRAP